MKQRIIMNMRFFKEGDILCTLANPNLASLNPQVQRFHDFLQGKSVERKA